MKRLRLSSLLLVWCLAALAGVPRAVYGRVGVIALEKLTRGADVIVLARVDQVQRISGVQVATATVLHQP
jgi:hypothetical protein